MGRDATIQSKDRLCIQGGANRGLGSLQVTDCLTDSCTEGFSWWNEANSSWRSCWSLRASNSFLSEGRGSTRPSGRTGIEGYVVLATTRGSSIWVAVATKSANVELGRRFWVYLGRAFSTHFWTMKSPRWLGNLQTIAFVHVMSYAKVSHFWCSKFSC